MPDLRNLTLALLFGIVLLTALDAVIGGFGDRYSSNIGANDTYIATRNVTHAISYSNVTRQMEDLNNATGNFAVAAASTDIFGLLGSGMQWATTAAGLAINLVMMFVPTVTAVAMMMSVGVPGLERYIIIIGGFVTTIVVYELISMIMKYRT